MLRLGYLYPGRILLYGNSDKIVCGWEAELFRHPGSGSFRKNRKEVFVMSQLLADLQQNLSFVLVSALIVAVIILLSRLGERFLPDLHRPSKARFVTIVGICAALAAVLYTLDFPLPFLAPDFYKLDFSELPVILCGFYLGPTAAVTCEAIKIVLKLLLKGTTTAFVGDLANFVVGCSFVIPAVILYHIHKTRKWAVWGLVAGTLVMTVFGSFFNAVYLLPKFAQLYFGSDLSRIIAMGGAVNPAISSVTTFVVLAVAPLNLIKGVLISVLTLLLYKRVARPLFGK